MALSLLAHLVGQRCVVSSVLKCLAQEQIVTHNQNCGFLVGERALAVNESLRILVAEDHADSVKLLQLAFERTGLDVPIDRVADGEEAVNYLQGVGVFRDRRKYPLPTMLLLDLRMPKLNGFEVLDWIRGQPQLRRLVVVVFTSSDDREDINRAYELGANSYVIKPVNFDELQQTVRNLEKYWLHVNSCPDAGCKGSHRFPAMRVLVRDTRTGLYLQSPGNWAGDPKKALDFERSERALEFILRTGTRQVEFVMEVEEEHYDARMRTAGSAE